MPKYTKIPVTIEAYQLPPDDNLTRRLPPRWLIDAMVEGTVKAETNGALKIKTLEGEMLAQVGDYIIQGVKGELYPCKPDIFELTYSLASK